jgi:hypothetical protein
MGRFVWLAGHREVGRHHVEELWYGSTSLDVELNGCISMISWISILFDHVCILINNYCVIAHVNFFYSPAAGCRVFSPPSVWVRLSMRQHTYRYSICETDDIHNMSIVFSLKVIRNNEWHF